MENRIWVGCDVLLAAYTAIARTNDLKDRLGQTCHLSLRHLSLLRQSVPSGLRNFFFFVSRPKIPSSLSPPGKTGL